MRWNLDGHQRIQVAPRSVAHALLPRTVETPGGTAATAKELLEEIAEARALEVEFRALSGTSFKSTLRLRRLPSRMVPARY